MEAWHLGVRTVGQALPLISPPNGQAFSGEPSERSERPERRVHWNAMLDGGDHLCSDQANAIGTVPRNVGTAI